MATAAERKREQRKRAASGSASAESIRQVLVRELQLSVNRWCRDTTQPEPSVVALVDKVADAFTSPSEKARVLAYLGYPVSRDDDPDLVIVHAP